MDDQHWTPARVEARLTDAADVLQRLPDVRVQGFISAWPDIVHSVHEAFGWHDPVLKRPRPSPASIDEMDEALKWFRWLEPDVAKIVWLRASGDRWKEICWKVGLQRTAVHQRYHFGHCVITIRLNGHAPPRNCSRRGVIAMVQSRWSET
jgi:hypothetical protein